MALTAALSAQSQPRGRSAPAAPKPAPAPAERRVPFRVGETLGFDVSWSSFLTAGEATVTVRGRRPVAGSSAYHVVADGRATGLVARLYHVYYRTETDLDTRSLLPHRASLYREEGRRRQTKVTRFDRAARRVHFDVTGHNPERIELAMPSDTQDPLSVLFALRALPFRPGLKATMPVASNGKLYRVEVTVHGRETVETPLGSRAAWRITPAIQRLAEGGGEPRRIVLWVSDDPQRLPLRVEADMPVGTFNLVLRDAGGQSGVD